MYIVYNITFYFADASIQGNVQEVPSDVIKHNYRTGWIRDNSHRIGCRAMNISLVDMVAGPRRYIFRCKFAPCFSEWQSETLLRSEANAALSATSL